MYQDTLLPVRRPRRGRWRCFANVASVFCRCLGILQPRGFVWIVCRRIVVGTHHTHGAVAPEAIDKRNGRLKRVGREEDIGFIADNDVAILDITAVKIIRNLARDIDNPPDIMSI